MRFSRLLSLLPLALTAGCSLLFNLSADQCKVHSDCDALGNEFVGRSCVVGVCESCKSDRACTDARGDDYVCKKPAGKTAGVCKLGDKPDPIPTDDAGSGDAQTDAATPDGAIMSASSAAPSMQASTSPSVAPSMSEPDAAEAGPGVECTTHQDCKDKYAPKWICIENSCVNLVTSECPVVLQSENLYTTDPIIIGAYSAIDPGNVLNGPITLSYDLALHDITENVGGLSGGANNQRRGFVAVVCEGQATAEAPVANSLAHLIDTLKVPGIVASLNTQDLIYAYEQKAKAAKVFMIDPLYADSTLTAEDNAGLLWFILGEWRNLAHAYVQLTKRAEDFQKLKSGDSEVRVALIQGNQRPHIDIANVLATDDVDQLEFNGKPALDDANADNFKRLSVSVDFADNSSAGEAARAALFDELFAFKPHIIVLTGGIEFVNFTMLPLEGSWVDETEVDGQVRPFYVLSPEMAGYASLSNSIFTDGRYSGIIERAAGINFAGYADRSLYAKYESNFKAVYTQTPFVEEHENFYDAMYYLAYSIAAAGNQAKLDGNDLALGMERITARGETSFSVGPANVAKTLLALQSPGSEINLKGTMGPSNFYPGTRTREVEGSVWCTTSEKASYNVLRLDPDTGELTGDPSIPCGFDF